MKLHIEQIHIHLPSQQPPAGLIAALAIAGAAQPAQPHRAPSTEAGAIPAIGDKWPGLEAAYVGVSLSQDGQRLVHLVLWDEAPEKSMTYADAVEAAEKINPAMESHLPTRHQSLDLFERLQDRFNQDYWHWTLDKTKSGKAAFVQGFTNGNQGTSLLSSECRVRAVSEIPL